MRNIMQKSSRTQIVVDQLIDKLKKFKIKKSVKMDGSYNGCDIIFGNDTVTVYGATVEQMEDLLYNKLFNNFVEQLDDKTKDMLAKLADMQESIDRAIKQSSDDNKAALAALEKEVNENVQKTAELIMQEVWSKFADLASNCCYNFDGIKTSLGDIKFSIAGLGSKLDEINSNLGDIKRQYDTIISLLNIVMSKQDATLVGIQNINNTMTEIKNYFANSTGASGHAKAQQDMLEQIPVRTKKSAEISLYELFGIYSQYSGEELIILKGENIFNKLQERLKEDKDAKQESNEYVISDAAVMILKFMIDQSSSQEEIDRLKKDLDEAQKRRNKAEAELEKLKKALNESAGHTDNEDYGLDAWDFSIKKNKIEITAYRGRAENLTIPASISGRPVVSIAGGTFKVNSSEEAKGAGSSIREVIISDGIAAIDSEAFSDCDSLETITIPASIRDLGSRAFCNCGSLWQINYNATKANDLSSEGLFANCGVVGCMEIIFGDSVEHIPANLCNGSHNLAKVTISSNVKTIGKDAFKNCESLTIYCEAKSRPSDWPEDWNSGCPVVWDCINNNVAENGYINIFDGKIRYEIKDNSAIVARQSTCLSGDIEIPESISYNGNACKVIRIAKDAFNFCKKLESIMIPDSVTSIGDCAFRGCTGLANGSVYYQGDLSGWLGIEFGSSSSNPMEYADNLYINGELLRGELVIPEGTEKIGVYAFKGCTGLTRIILPKGVTSIGDGAFLKCASLNSITIPASVKCIGEGAFFRCYNLSSIDIPKGVTNIGKEAFSKCTGLESITIPDSVEDMGSSVFKGCFALKMIYCQAQQKPNGWASDWNPENREVTWYSQAGATSKPDGGNKKDATPASTDGSKNGTTSTSTGGSKKSVTPKATDSRYFDYKTYKGGIRIKKYIGNAKDVVIPSLIDGKRVTSIGNWAFWRCTGLTSITIPDSVTSIGNWVFFGCTGLTSITIPDSVTSIGDYAFDDCDGLTDVYYQGDLSGWLGIEFGGYTSNPMEYAANLYIKGELQGKLVIPEGTEKIGSYAFYNCSNLTSITIPDSVTSIGDSAFGWCTGLTDVYYQGDLSGWLGIEFGSSISNPMFYASNLYIKGELLQGKLVIPEGTEKIGEYAFCGCTGLTSITIPDSVTSIGDLAFSDCSGLTSITIPDSVKRIGEYAFDSCGELTIYCEAARKPLRWSRQWNPDNRPVYWGQIIGGTRAKKNTGFFRDHKIPIVLIAAVIIALIVIIPIAVHFSERASYDLDENGTLTIYGSGEITGKIPGDGVKNVIIEEGITRIGDGAFLGCTGLTSITIPDSVTSIGEGAFRGCSGLTSITIPDSVTSIGEGVFKGAFMGCSSLESIEVEKGNSRYHSKGNCLIETASKTLIAGCSNSVIPSDGSVTSIGEGAFYYCTGLTNITIPDSVTGIGFCAFWGCTGLTSITIPDSVTSIGDNAFLDCSGLIDVYYQGDLSGWLGIEFGDYNSNLMDHADNLYINGELLQGELVIPEGTEKIGDYAFKGCTSLTSITIPDSVTSIGYSAFLGCTDLTDVYYQGDLSGWLGIEFGGYASNPIYYADNLYINGELLQGDLMIPEGTEKIDIDEFRGCNGLTSVTIPDSVTSIGFNAFLGCSGLIDVYYQGDLSGWLGMEFVYSSSNPMYYADNLYINGELLQGKLVIPEGTENIGDYVFYGCRGLTSITIPDSVTSIGDDAFSYCRDLTDITFQGTMQQWNDISKGTSWDSGSGSYTVTCTDGVLDKSGQQIG